MKNLSDLDLWPPAGWPQFKTIEKSCGQSLAKDAAKARIYGLQYRIDSVSLFKDQTKYLRHDVFVDGWEYSILNESIEYPVLSFSLMDRFDNTLPQECFISDIRTYASAIPHTRASANRCVSAGIFLINQVANGHVPDVNRVLRVYKLHPTQAFLYSRTKRLDLDLQRAFDAGNTQASTVKQA